MATRFLRRSLLVTLLVLLGAPDPAIAANPNWPNAPTEDPRLEPPDDPGFKRQWNLWSFVPEEWAKNPGFRTAEIALGTGIHADRAWQLTTGNPAVHIAVLDSGIRWSRRDLANQVYLNRGELAAFKPQQTTPPAPNDFDVNGDGRFSVEDYCAADASWCTQNDTNGNGFFDAQDLIRLASDGTDTDGDGFIDDIAGWDCYRNDNDPYDDTDFGHGSGEASDSTAEGNNGAGEIGVCPGCMFTPVRVGDSFVVDTNDFGCGVVFAVDSGASLIQEALGGINHTAYAREAIEYAYASNVAVVASAADELSFHHNTPGTQNHTLYVHAIVFDKEKAERSTTFLNFNNCTNYGAQLLLSTPGTGCSSEATGISSGHVGLIYSAALDRPDGPLDPPLSAEEIRGILIQSTDDIDVPESLTDTTKFPSGPGWDLHFGYGRNNARRSLDLVFSGEIPPEADLVEPFWFEPVNVAERKSIEVRGRVGTRTDGLAPRYANFHYVLEYALGVDPKSGWATIVEDNTTGLDGLIATWDLAPVAARLDLDTPPASPHAHFVTLRLRVEAEHASGKVLKNEFRKGFHLIKDPDLLAGFPIAFHTSIESSAKMADLDGDKAEEMIFVASDGWVHAIKGDGSEVKGFPVALALRAELDPASAGNIRGACAFAPEPKPERCAGKHGVVSPDARETTIAAPAVADLDRDEDLEVIVSTWDGRVWVIHHDGSIQPGFPVEVDRSLTHPTFPKGEEPEEDEVVLDDGIMAAPVIANLDPSDDALEIIVAAMDQHVYVWKIDGSLMPGWPVLVQDPFSVARARIVSTPAVGDADGDGSLDIAVGTNEAFGASGAENEGRCYLLHADGNAHAGGAIQKGWPVKAFGLQDNVLPVVGAGVPSNMVMADLDYNGDLEINCDAISGRGSFYNHDGTLFAEMNNVDFGKGSPSKDAPAYALINNGAFGRVDREGGIDFVKGTAGFNFALTFVSGGTRAEFDHHVSAWDTLTGDYLENWPRVIEDWQFFMNPIIVDIDNDTNPEVISGSGGYLLHAWNHKGVEPASWPKNLGGWIITSPTVGDLDGDGVYEVTAATRAGWLFAWHTPGKVASSVLEWRSYQHDVHNTGNYNTPLPVYGARPSPPPVDPGPSKDAASSADGNADLGVPAGDAGGRPDATETPSTSGGGGCRAGGAMSPGPSAGLLLALLGLACLGRRRGAREGA